KGREEGMRLGAIQKAQEAVLRFLEVRFGPLPPELKEKVKEIQELAKLDRLVEAAAKCQSLAEWEADL
ncbi:MAG: DUF4351 domain-containing protein, partial [Planctomycetota bacterium]